MSFLKLINKNKIFKQNSKILDIGTGGFCGENTLVHYMNIIPNENIYCIEYNESSYKKLFDKYKHTKINMSNDDFFLLNDDIKFDLIICDFDSGIFMNRFDDIIKKVKSLLSKDGYIILMATGNLDNVTTLTSNKESINLIKHIYESIWKTNNITDAVIQTKLNNDFKILESFDHTNFTRYILIQKL
jgi:phospholipid N-methyltransferase